MTTTEVREMRECDRQGWTRTYIGLAFNRSPKTISNYLGPAPRRGPPRVADPQQVLKLHRKGWLNRAIAKHLGVSEARISQILKGHKVPYRRLEGASWMDYAET